MQHHIYKYFFPPPRPIDPPVPFQTRYLPSIRMQERRADETTKCIIRATQAASIAPFTTLRYRGEEAYRRGAWGAWAFQVGVSLGVPGW